jgi:hypothetical protein
MLVVTILLMSIALGLLVGGPQKAEQILNWELKQFLAIGRLSLKFTLRTVANMCQWVHKKL